MISFLRDPANAITVAGIALSAAALQAILAGRIELAVALALWSMLADQLDGVVARRTRDRGPDIASVGKGLDGFNDLLYGAVVPALALIQATGWLPAAYPIGALLVVVGALRLANFSVFGLQSGRFEGVPLSYDVPLLALLLLGRPWLPAASFGAIVTSGFAVLAVLHIAPVSVPAPRGRSYAVIVLTAAVLSVALVARSLSSPG